MEEIDKLNAIVVSQGLIDELKNNRKISSYDAKRVIEYGHFLAGAWQIVNRLFCDLYCSQNSNNIRDIKCLLQKIVDENLYGKNLKIKKYIEKNSLNYDKKKQAIYRMLCLSRMLHQLQRTAPSNSLLKYFNNDFIQKIVEQFPETNLLTKLEKISVIKYIKDKITLTKQYTREIFWSRFFVSTRNLNHMLNTSHIDEKPINNFINKI